MDSTYYSRLLRGLILRDTEERSSYESSALNNFVNFHGYNYTFEGGYETLRALLFNWIHENVGVPTVNVFRDFLDNNHQIEASMLLLEVMREDFLAGADYRSLFEKYRQLTALQLMGESFQDGLQQLSLLNQTNNLSDSLYKQAQLTSLKLFDTQKLLFAEERPTHVSDGYEYFTQSLPNRRQNSMGLSTGLTEIDQVTLGGHYGQLWTIGAFTSQGKTTFCLNWSYRLFMSGYSGLFFSLEMTVEEIWDVFYMLYLTDPVHQDRSVRDITSIMQGSSTNTEDRSRIHQYLLPEFRNRYLLQEDPPYFEVFDDVYTMADIQMRAEAIAQRHPLDFIVIDYLGLVEQDASVKTRLSTYERVNTSFRRAKMMAQTFNRGDKILVITPHQINREGYQRARDNDGVYDLRALAEAPEAEKSSNVVICGFQDDTYRARGEIKISNLKNRGGPLMSPQIYAFDGPSRRISNHNIPWTASNSLEEFRNLFSEEDI